MTAAVRGCWPRRIGERLSGKQELKCKVKGCEQMKRIIIIDYSSHLLMNSLKYRKASHLYLKKIMTGLSKLCKLAIHKYYSRAVEYDRTFKAFSNRIEISKGFPSDHAVRGCWPRLSGDAGRGAYPIVSILTAMLSGGAFHWRQ